MVSASHRSCSVARSVPNSTSGYSHLLGSLAISSWSSSIASRVAHAREVLLDEPLVSRSTRRLVDKVGEDGEVEAHVSRTWRTTNDVGLRVVHVVGQVGERHLGLDHPELGEVARRVGVLGAEGWAERVDVAEGARVGLGGELARDGEVRGLTEEVRRVRVGRLLHLSLLQLLLLLLLGRRRRRLRRVERRHAEHLAGALAVRGGDEGRLDVAEALGGEEGVRRLRERRAHARDRAEEVAPRPQVGDGAHELERVALLLQRVGVRGARADELDGLGGDLDGLPFPLDATTSPTTATAAPVVSSPTTP